MALPNSQKLRLPVLQILSEAGKPLHIEELTDAVCERLGISQEERKKYRPGRPQTKSHSIITTRIYWACLDLKLAKWVRTPETKDGEKIRGHSVLTKEGNEIAKKVEGEKLDVINQRYLYENSDAYREYIERRKSLSKLKNKDVSSDESDDNADENLTEKIDRIFEEIQSDLHSKILQRIIDSEHKLLEKLSIKLMNAMGYGEEVDSEHTGKAGDGGVDAVVREDKLGLGVINIQTKRYKTDNPIQPSAIREFSGTLRAGVSKGVFITTSTFTKGAVEESKLSSGRIVLIDGEKLVKLMIKYSIGVKRTREAHAHPRIR